MGVFGQRHHQVAYVTNDLDRAMEIYARDYGIPKFFMLPNAVVDGKPIKLALAQVNGVEIELIEPAKDFAIYADFLPKDGSFAIAFHHLCFRIEGDLADWDRHRGELDEEKHPVVFEGAFGDDVRFAYTDERRRLGHYLEHVWFSPAHIAQMKKLVPSYPA